MILAAAEKIILDLREVWDIMFLKPGEYEQIKSLEENSKDNRISPTLASQRDIQSRGKAEQSA